MGSSLLIQFDGARKERDLIGRILLGYGEIEFTLLTVLGGVLNNNLTALRTMYQLRSEVNRLAVVEALATPHYQAAGLGGQFKEGLDAANHCKTIRNQYAHATWKRSPKGVLTFANLELPAKTKTPQATVVAHPITEALLQKQWAYFEYTDHMLAWLNQQLVTKLGTGTAVKVISKPQRLSPPKLHSHGEALVRLSLSVKTQHPQ